MRDDKNLCNRESSLSPFAKNFSPLARFFATTANFLHPDLLKYGNRSKDNRAPSEIAAAGVDELTIIIVKLQRNFEARRFKEAILSNA